MFTSDELERFDRLVAELQDLIAGSQSFYALLAAGEIPAASEYFRDVTRTQYFSITAGSYTLFSGVSREIDRLGRLGRNIE